MKPLADMVSGRSRKVTFLVLVVEDRVFKQRLAKSAPGELVEVFYDVD